MPPPVGLRLQARQLQTIHGASGASVVAYDGTNWDFTLRDPNVLYFLHGRHLVQVR